ncbi:hypothetical protein DEO72_LG10g2155 [Vigna unguiculata]|uniref:Uncharacterized protein n=1 Tax=Vigna unguiculata TaxID=3917 RepID=A0A4D6NDE7_VIGUN|nr:hypothetical protein DEO72_LG10g2155 [Vigna unguiculata]
MVRNWDWESLLRLYYAVLCVQCCQIELVCFGSVLGFWCSACVRGTVPEPAILAQASQACLGEICKDLYSYHTQGYRPGGGFRVWARGRLA